MSLPEFHTSIIGYLLYGFDWLLYLSLKTAKVDMYGVKSIDSALMLLPLG